MKVILLCSLIILSSCGRDTDYTFYPVNHEVVVKDYALIKEAYYKGCMYKRAAKKSAECSAAANLYVGGGK